MKIGIATNFYYPSIGGAEKVVQIITEYLAKFHEVVVFTRQLPNRKYEPFQQYKLKEYRPGNVAAFEQEINSCGLDVLLIYSDVFDYFRHIALRQNPFKLILALCGANWLFAHRNLVNLFSRNANNIHAIVCHSTRERDYRLCSSDPLAKKVIVIPNGVDVTEFDENTLTRQDLAPDIADKRWLLNVSNFFPGKGQEHLVDILAKLPNPDEFAYIQVSSDIPFAVGTELEIRWKTRLHKTKSKYAVHVAKNVSRSEVIGYFKQSNVFVFTSEKEVAPLVLLESMAAKLPWIATNVGNAADLDGGISITAMKNNNYHSHFDERVHDDFINGIQKLWNTPKIGELGRSQIDKTLTWDKILPQYLNIIEASK